jgi:CHAD domain-containing protein
VVSFIVTVILDEHAGGATVQRGELLFAPTGHLEQVLGVLSARYCVAAGAAEVAHWTYLDTVDWRLHNAGMSLRDSRQGTAAELVLSTRSGAQISAPSRVRRWPRRADTLPGSTVRDQLGKAVGVRALLPMAQVQVRSIPLRLTDDLDKTRVRIRVEQHCLVGSGDQPLPLRVVIAPLRGYDRDGDRCATLLANDLPQFDSHDPVATIAMTAAGRPPGQPSVATLSLDPADPAAASAAAVLRRWMDIIDAVRAGVLDDVDPEYLHDLRTAVRATRSILRLGGEPLSGTAEWERFAAEFAWLGQLTTPLRDIDVYLEELAGRGELNVSGLDDLDPLVTHLTRRRAHAVRAVRAGLRSDRGMRLSADWRCTLDGLASARAPGLTTRDLAAQHARSAYRRIVRAAAPVTERTPPDHLHRLRRRCKQMRYLLDGYDSVYAPLPHRAVLSALKQLQNCLGDIQDSDVQRSQLADTAAALIVKGVPVATVLAMGALRDRNATREHAAREDLRQRLRVFTGREMTAHVAALAAPGS